MSYEIIDPSLHVMVNKASDQATLLNENKELKQWNLIVIISSLIIIGAAIALSLKEKRNTKDDKRKLEN